MKTAARESEGPRPPDVFISYSRKDKEFVRRLDEALQTRGREAWVDWEGIRPTEEFMQAIYGAIEGADTFVFVLTPDSVASAVCAREIAHAAAHNKRMVPIVAREVDTQTVPEPLAKLNWIFCRESDDLEAAVRSLVSALETDLEWVHAHTRLLTRALEWDANKKSNSFVLRGEDLRSAEQWLAQAGTQKERQPTALQTDYIIASRKATAQRQRMALGSLVFGLLVAIALAVVAWSQRNHAQRQAQIASAGRLAGFGLSFLRDQLPLSLLLGVEAYRTADTVEARNTLVMALQTEPGLVTFLHGHSGPVDSIAFSPDGRSLASGGTDGTVRLWDLEGRRQIGPPLHQFTTRIINSKNSVRSLSFSPDGTSIAAGTFHGNLALWNVSSRESQGELELGGTVNSVVFSPDGECVTVDGDAKFSLRDKATVKLVSKPIWRRDATWKVQLGPVEPDHAILSPDGTTLLVCINEELSLWEIGTHNLIGKLPGHFEGITGLCYSPNGRIIVAADRTGAIRVWDADSRAAIGEPVTKSSGSILNMAFTADSKTLFWGGIDGAVHRYDVEHAGLVGNPIAVGRFASFDVSPDGRYLAVGARDGTTRIHEVEPSPLLGDKISDERVSSLAFSKDGVLLTVAGEHVKVLNAQTRKSLGILKYWNRVQSLTFIGADHRVALGCEDGAIRFWDADTLEPIGEPLRGHKEGSAIWSIASTPDGAILASGGSDGTLRLWETRTRKQIGEPVSVHGQSVYCVAFNSTGTVLASGGQDKAVRLWDARARQALGAPLQGHSDAVWSLAFSPDGKVLASGDNTGTLLLWNVSNHSRLGEPVPGHVSRIAALAFSPDGKVLVTAGFGGTLRFVDAGSRQPLGIPILPEGEYATVNAVAYSPDGNTVAAGLNSPPGLFLLDASPASWQARAARRANRNLSLAEWKRFFGDPPYRRTFPDWPAGDGTSHD